MLNPATTSTQSEVDSNSPEEYIEKPIRELLSQPEHKWRTPRGIAETTGLPLQEVESYIKSHPEIFREFPMRPAGVRLYGLQPDQIEKEENNSYGLVQRLLMKIKKLTEQL